MIKERLAQELADRYLDPDATRLPDFEASIKRAEMVINIDQENVKARCFLLRATTYHTDVRLKEGDKYYSTLFRQLEEIKRHAEWLERRLRNMPENQRSRVQSDICNYYDQMGEVKHAEGYDSVNDANKALNAGDAYGAKRHLQNIKQCYEASDSYYRKSLKLCSPNTRAQERLDHHSKESKSIDNLFSQIQMAGY